MLQGLMPSGLPQAPVNSTGVAKQEARYEVDGEMNKDWGKSNDRGSIQFWSDMLVRHLEMASELGGNSVLVFGKHCSVFVS